MDEMDWLAERFESHRTHLRGVGYQMLGSLPEADDAVQESWLRLSRSSTSEVKNLGSWLASHLRQFISPARPVMAFSASAVLDPPGIWGVRGAGSIPVMVMAKGRRL